MIRIFLFNVLLYTALNAAAQEKFSPVEPLSRVQMAALVQEVTGTQIKFIRSGGIGFRYRSHWSEREKAETAEVIGSADGRISRLLEQDGQPITAETNTKETKRLESLLNPGKLQDATKSAKRFRPYFVELVQAMPQAMLYTPTPGQPQRPDLSHTDVNHRQIVLDYSPNPGFHPKSLAESALVKLSGRLWIDEQDHHLLRMEIHIDADVNVAGGLVAKVFAGGTVEYDQRLIAEGQYAWTHIRLNLRLRELLVKIVPLDADLNASGIQLLSPIPSGPAAIRSLLTMQVKTR